MGMEACCVTVCLPTCLPLCPLCLCVSPQDFEGIGEPGISISPFPDMGIDINQSLGAAQMFQEALVQPPVGPTLLRPQPVAVALLQPTTPPRASHPPRPMPAGHLPSPPQADTPVIGTTAATQAALSPGVGDRPQGGSTEPEASRLAGPSAAGGQSTPVAGLLESMDGLQVASDSPLLFDHLVDWDDLLQASGDANGGLSSFIQEGLGREQGPMAVPVPAPGSLPPPSQPASEMRQSKKRARRGTGDSSGAHVCLGSAGCVCVRIVNNGAGRRGRGDKWEALQTELGCDMRCVGVDLWALQAPATPSPVKARTTAVTRREAAGAATAAPTMQSASGVEGAGSVARHHRPRPPRSAVPFRCPSS